MMQTGGFVVLFAWLIFLGLLALLAFLLLREHVDVHDEAERRTDGARDRPPRGRRAGG